MRIEVVYNLSTMQPDVNKLSDRELEILRLVATGASNKEIAQRLSISTNTVKVHLRNIYEKIHVNSRTEAAMLAVSAGIVSNISMASERKTIAEPEIDLDQQGGSVSEISADSSKVKPQRRWQYIIIAVLIIALASVVSYVVWSYNQEQPSINNNQGAVTWKNHAPMPTARFGLAAVVLENSIYVIGGETEKTPTGMVEVYYPDGNRWITRKAKPIPVADIQAAVHGGKIYVPGGRLASGERSDVLEIYDPVLDEWTLGAPMPIKSSGYALATLGSEIYLFGGSNEDGYLSTVLAYNTEADEWEFKQALDTPRAFAGAAVVGQNIYLLGGLNSSGPLKLIELYSPASESQLTDSRTTLKAMPGNRYGMGVTSILNVIFMGGGLGKDDESYPLQGYLTSSDDWQTIIPADDTTWSRMGFIPYGNDIFAIGGKVGELPSNDLRSVQVVYVTILPFIR